MKKSSSVLLSFSLILSTLYLSFPSAYASETCTTDSGSGNGKNHVVKYVLKNRRDLVKLAVIKAAKVTINFKFSSLLV